MTGLGQGWLGPIAGVVGGILTGGTSIVQSQMQAEALAKQLKAQKQQQRFEAQQSLQQAEQMRQQALFGASKDVRSQETVILAVVGLAAAGVAAWLFYKARQKA